MIPQQGRLEISRQRLRHNLDLIRNKIGRGVKICATVKANAYGHGAREIVPLLREAGVDWLAVYSAAEIIGEVMRDHPVLVLSPIVDDGKYLEQVIDEGQNVRFNVTDHESARAISEARIDRDEG